jgi:1-acyl-sn-glycerol-3-phosphate acyltransferase
MIMLRSLLFNIGFWALTIVIGLGSLPMLVAPRQQAVAMLRFYGRMVLRLLRVTCGIRVQVEGAERLPQGGAALIAAKHQSAFDTMVWFTLLPDTCYVLKRELLWLPIWGWYAWKTGQIAVDRAAGASAMRHLLKSGRQAAADGRQLVIFPEGTRVAPHKRVPYQPGIAALASATGLSVIPVATDSGVYWGRRAFTKRPGTITIAVLPAIPPGLPRAALLRELETRIESATDRLLARLPVDKPVDNAAPILRPEP